MKYEILEVLALLVMASFINVAFADESLEASYTASRNVNYTVPIGSGSFDVTVTLVLKVIYTCSVDGVLPGASTCHVNVAPYSGTLTVDYHIEPPIGLDLDGSKSIPLPQGGQELLGDSPPIVIPVESTGDIMVLIHGCLLADFTTSAGSINPHSLQWSTWETRDMVVSASTKDVLLTIETEYSVSFTVTVALGSFTFPSRNIPIEQFPGDRRASFVIPEFPTLITYIVAIMVPSSVTLVASKKISDQDKLKDGSEARFIKQTKLDR